MEYPGAFYPNPLGRGDGNTVDALAGDRRDRSDVLWGKELWKWFQIGRKFIVNPGLFEDWQAFGLSRTA